LPEFDYDCIPCLSQKCFQSKPCVNYIKPQKVFDTIEKIMKG